MEDGFDSPLKKQKKEDSSTLPPIRHLLESIDSTFTYQPEKSQLKIVNQPDPYQISNYNVQPTLAIELPYDMSECVITAELVLNFVVANGFQAGGTQVVPRNTRLMMFHGLKLSTMTIIKDEAKRQHISVKESDFVIRITVGGLVAVTRPFKIVSSFSQLPKEFRELRSSRNQQ